MTSEITRNLKLMASALICSALFFLYSIFLGRGLCETIMLNGGNACGIEDRINYLHTELEVAVMYGILAIFCGSCAAFVLAYLKETFLDGSEKKRALKACSHIEEGGEAEDAVGGEQLDALAQGGGRALHLLLGDPEAHDDLRAVDAVDCPHLRITVLKVDGDPIDLPQFQPHHILQPRECPCPRYSYLGICRTGAWKKVCVEVAGAGAAPIQNADGARQWVSLRSTHPTLAKIAAII
ncbi:hypothetical protein [Hyphomonas oceanitis]|uniref:hypothetical protein n=1 Tax=Hyphomonas oceanitis TaxID=81033 RepID=UPI0030012FD7